MLTLPSPQVGNTIGAGLDFVEVHYGFGRRQAYLSDHQLNEFRKYTYGEWIQTFFTLMWTKVSICLFLIRLPQSKRLKRPLQWAVAFLLLSNVVLSVMWIMQCQPIHAAWDDDGKCLSKNAKEGIVLTQAIISVVSDFTLAAFPILLLWRVQIDLKTKIGLWSIMCLGFFTGACCLVRTVLNGEALPADQSYGGIVNWVWRLFEVTIGIILACVPTLRPLYHVIVNKATGKSRTTDTNIRMPLEEQLGSWAEKTRGGGVASEAGATGQDVAEGKHPDAMRKELENEGIVKRNDSMGNGEADVVQGRLKKDRNAPNGGAPEGVAVHRPAVVREEDGDLEDEMQRYGVDNDIV